MVAQGEEIYDGLIMVAIKAFNGHWIEMAKKDENIDAGLGRFTILGSILDTVRTVFITKMVSSKVILVDFI